MGEEVSWGQWSYIVICNPHHIWLKWSNQRGWDLWGMWHKWDRREMHTCDHLYELSIGGRILLKYKEMGWEGVDWIDLTQVKDQWWMLVSLVKELEFPCIMMMEFQSSTGCREFLTSWIAVSFSRWTVLHAVSQLEWLYSTSNSKLHGWVMEYISFPVVLYYCVKVWVCKSNNDITHIDDLNLFYWHNFLTEYVIDISWCNYTSWGFISCVTRLVIVKNVHSRFILPSCLIVYNDFLTRFPNVCVPEMGMDRSIEILLLISWG